MVNGTSPQIRVLLVDNDVRTSRIFARMLKEDGFQAEVAADGAAAIGRLSRSPMPDVVVTDLAMAHPSGLAVALYARSRCPSVPIFFLTDHPELAHGVERALSPEPQVITKPLDYTAFHQELSRALRGERSHKQERGQNFCHSGAREPHRKR